jgi:hypothetical protein
VPVSTHILAQIGTCGQWPRGSQGVTLAPLSPFATAFTEDAGLPAGLCALAVGGSQSCPPEAVCNTRYCPRHPQNTLTPVNLHSHTLSKINLQVVL